MAFARDVDTATASQTDFTISFPYLSQSDVKVFVDGVLQTLGGGNDYTFFNATTIRFNTGLTGGETVIRQRSTSQNARLTDYTATTLTEADLDNDSLQGFYMAQEAIDIANTSMTLNSGNQWDGDNKRIEDVADPTAAQHAATRAYGDANWGGTAAANAAASAAAAATSASNAATSETNAANSFDQFDDRYLGDKASDPALDNDGNALLTGALYFNTTSDVLRVYDGTSWNDVGTVSMTTFTYTATAAQTAFSGSDDNSNTMSFASGAIVSVTLNGVKLVEGGSNDYTTTSTTTVTLNSGAAVDDVLEVVVAANFSVADAISTTTGDSRYFRKTDIDTDGNPMDYKDGAGWTYTSQVATTSGTTVTITTAIPADATEVEVFLNGVSTSSNSENPTLQIGPSSGPVTTGYVSTVGSNQGSAGGEHASTTEFDLFRPAFYIAADAITGSFLLSRWDPDEHLWIIRGTSNDGGNEISYLSGHITLSGALTDMRLNTPGGTATFDAGEVRVRYR